MGRSRLSRQWRFLMRECKSGRICLLLKFWFSNLDSCEYVFPNGLWHIQNKSIILRSGSLISDLRGSIWIGFRGSILNVFLQSCSLVQVCVKLEADFRVPKIINVQLCDGTMASIEVAIPWIPHRCFHCRVFGRNERSCEHRKKLIRAMFMLYIDKCGVVGAKEVVSVNAAMVVDQAADLEQELAMNGAELVAVQAAVIEQELDMNRTSLAESDNVVFAAASTEGNSVPVVEIPISSC
ncbi:hypothetical protein F3Y22_tig00110931pilonHSYRG00051 [Hibiscus syriacus]|uniref:DUF4283 domain-containing protein n=1 Tax=Hibiscus syriacus TaxID=106335 RepID=A0A6A2ZEH7_HIBSY|nr:hypothetical protein F3Y22_tig00110931pilonHSYRG00051 [Hibiscus syriacus]